MSSCKMTSIKSPSFALSLRGGEGQQGHDSGLLHGGGEVALVKGAGAGDPPGNDPAPLGDEIGEEARVLEIGLHFLIGAKSAGLSAPEAPSLHASPVVAVSVAVSVSVTFHKN